MLSEADGFVGWLVLAWTLLIGVVLYFWYGHRPQHTIP
jgi:hypothetical protein